MTNNKEREARYAEALHLRYPFEGAPARDEVRAVMAVADAEQAAALHQHGRQVRETMRQIYGADRAALVARAEAAAAELAALRGRIEALATSGPFLTRWIDGSKLIDVDDLRAALAASPAEDTTPAAPHAEQCRYPGIHAAHGRCPGVPDYDDPAPVADPSGDTEGGQA